jgi:hypothetical protein
MNAQCDAGFVFYARSVEEAEEKVTEILTEHEFERVHLKPWPYEFMRFFRLELPTVVGISTHYHKCAPIFCSSFSTV